MPSNRGVVYLGLGKAQVQDIDFPTFYNPAGKAIDHGVILKAVATNICGSDQHMMRGRVDDALSGRRHSGRRADPIGCSSDLNGKPFEEFRRRHFVGVGT